MWETCIFIFHVSHITGSSPPLPPWNANDRTCIKNKFNLSLLWSKYISLQHHCLPTKKQCAIHWCWILNTWKCKQWIVTKAPKYTKWILTTTSSCVCYPQANDTLAVWYTAFHTWLVLHWWLHSWSKVRLEGLLTFIIHYLNATFAYLPWCQLNICDGRINKEDPLGQGTICPWFLCSIL